VKDPRNRLSEAETAEMSQKADLLTE